MPVGLWLLYLTLNLSVNVAHDILYLLPVNDWFDPLAVIQRTNMDVLAESGLLLALLLQPIITIWKIVLTRVEEDAT